MHGAIEQVPSLIRKLYSIVNELESLFTYRKFTLDGHLVGSIGEVMAKSMYDIELLPASTPAHDAVSSDCRNIQIKMTQGKSIGLREQPDYLIVLRLDRQGDVTEIYNGSGKQPWEAAGTKQSNGQKNISLARLKRLMESADILERIPFRGQLLHGK